MRQPLSFILALAAVIAAPTPALAEPAPISDQEAWNLAVQVSDRLQPSVRLQALAKKMVGAARAAEPAVANFGIPGPGWGTTSLLVSFEEGTTLASIMAPWSEELGITELQKYSFGNSGVVKWETPANVPALKKLVDERPGVKSASLNRFIGISAAVSLRQKGGGYELSYFQGSGDCPAGCIDKKFWRFRFDAEGNLLGQSIDEGRKKSKLGKGPGLGIMPAPGSGGPTILPAPGAGLGLEPPEDPNAEVEFSAPGRPGSYRR